MQLTDFTQYTSGCFHGEPASCACACPFGLDVRGLMEKCNKGRWNAAWKAYRTAVVFPAVVAALCPAPCQGACQRAALGGAIDLPGVENAILRFAKRKAEGYNIPPRTQKVAVVGAGPAGLSLALNMALKKYPVTVFEQAEGWGGSLRGHEKFSEFDEDFRLQFSAVKEGFITFEFGREIADASELGDFEAVYFATGEGGWQAEGEGRFFAGGGLIGQELMDAIAMGPEASKAIEAFLMTGRPGAIELGKNAAHCGRTVPHPGVEAAAPVETESQEGAMAEAGRCLQCDCSQCMDSCEMLQLYRKNPHGIAREAYADSAAAPPIATQSLVRQTYSCTNCGKCADVCPENADLGSLFLLSRADRFRRGTGPKAFHDYWLREMDFATGPAAAALVPKEQEDCTFAFFPGCRLGMDNPEAVKSAYRFLLDKTGGDTGLILGCCGVPALWAGDEERFQRNLEQIRSDWAKMGRPTLVFACATCERSFAEHLPEISQVSLYELMAEAELTPQGGVYEEAAVFDPCAARSDSAMREAVRSMAQQAGTKLEELPEACRCCGYGGHIQIPNPALYRQLGENGANQSDKPYLVYCANCKEVFRTRGKDCRHILETYFGDSGEGVPTILEKRRNALALKQSLLKEYWDMDFSPETAVWDALELQLSDELQAKLEENLISLADLKETIWNAETGGDRLISDDGSCLASMVKPAVTYWVQYRPDEGGSENAYRIETAYSHRMRWRGAEEA